MGAFRQLRLWFRQGPAAERTMTLLAGVLVLALAVWSVVPTNTGGDGDTLVTGPGGTTGDTTGSGSAASGTVTGQTGGAATGQTGTIAGPGTGTAGTVGSTSGTTATSGTVGTGSGSGVSTGTTTGTPSSCPVGNASEGVTAKEIVVGIALVDIGPLNSTINIPTQEQHQAAYRAVFNDINARGGVACRKLVPKFYQDPVINADQERAVCLQMQQDKLFAVINNLFNNQNTTCVAQARIPNYWYTPPQNPALERYYPYILSVMPDYKRLFKQYVHGLKALGWFKGANKVGILEQSCYPHLNNYIHQELTAAGFPSSRWSRFNYGCSSTALSTPDQNTGAAIQFNREGVTHIVSTSYANSPEFAKAAEQQQYRPKYALPSDAQCQALDKSSTGPPSSYDGSLCITMDQIGAQHTPGIKWSPATERCRALIRKAGLTDPVADNGGTAAALYGIACASSALLAASISKAPTLTRSALAAGLGKVGVLDLSFPAGPSNFTNPRNPTGGYFWRPIAFHYDCNCWRVSSQTWRKPFT